MNFPRTAEITVSWCVELRKTCVCLAAVTMELLLLLQSLKRGSCPEDIPDQDMIRLFTFLCYTLS